MKNFSNIFLYTKYFRNLIDLEREENIKLHKTEIKKLSGKIREEKGRAILKLNGKYDGRSLGGTFLVKFIRDDWNKLPDTEIGVGDLVIVTNKNKPCGKEVQGTVTEKTQYTITVAYLQRPPAYHFKQNLRLDLFSNDISYQRMQIALHRIKSKMLIQRLLLGRNISSEKESKYTSFYYNEKLNNNQKKAIEKSIESKELFLLHGPPGTGKTTTLIESILQHLHFNDKILVTADSNTAVDNLLEKLSEYNVNVVRVGNPSRMKEDLIEYSLDFLVQKEAFFKDARGLWREVDDLKKKQDIHGAKPTKENRNGLSNKQIKRFAKKRKSCKGVPAPLIRKMAVWLNTQDQVRGISKKAKILEDEAIKRILSKAQIICTTNSSSGGDLLENYCKLIQTKFDVLFIDEATQATEPSCLVPMINARKYVFAGDHLQLPPTVLSKDARDLQHTLFERLMERYGRQHSAMLKIQYRMNKEIMKFSNKQFYHGELIAHSSVANHTVEGMVKKLVDMEKTVWLKELLQPKVPCVFLNTSIDKEAYEFQKEGSTSQENLKEAKIIEQIIQSLFTMGLKEKDIGIITPYDDQVNLLKEKLIDYKNIEIKSVDGFQGREKEVIIISFVRANENGELGFLTDLRRLNVAITRAKRKLIMIGHKNTLKNNKTYSKLMGEVKTIELC